MKQEQDNTAIFSL